MGREVGAWLVGIGVVLVVAGVLAWAGWLSWFGRLPGDIRIERGNTQIFIPLTSMLLVSIVLSVLLALVRRR
jgi:hypothetical protein